MKYFFGVAIPRGSDFFQTLSIFFTNIGTINYYVLMVSLATLLTGITIRKLWPRIPYMIVALLVGSLLAWVLNTFWDGHASITTVGALLSSLPPLSMPDFSMETIRKLAPGVIAVTLLALTEAISIARSIALRSGQSIDSNQEFIAQGLSNMAGSFFSAYVATGSFNRSGLNYEAGARTPLAAAFSGLLLIGIVLLLAPITAWLPHAAMAAVLFVVAWGLVDFHHIRQTLHGSRSESIIMIATFIATLSFDLEIAILFGVMLSLGIYLSRTSHPSILIRVPDKTHQHRFISPKNTPECPQLRIIRIDGSLFFAAVNSIQEKLDALLSEGNRCHLAIVSAGINFIDLSGAEFLTTLATRLRNAGGGLYLIRLKETPYALLEHGGYMETIGRENCFALRPQAIQHIFTKLDANICTQCPYVVFKECNTVRKEQASNE